MHCDRQTVTACTDGPGNLPGRRCDGPAVTAEDSSQSRGGRETFARSCAFGTFEREDLIAVHHGKQVTRMRAGNS